MMQNKPLNILICGVGGQGTLLASRILGSYGARMGYDVKLNEVHGMAQRGGSVVTHVRFGTDLAAPVIEPGCADALVSFEQLETARWQHYVADDGIIVTGLQKRSPMPVITGAAVYPDEPLAQAKSRVRVVDIDADALALEAGDLRAVNCVLLGALAKHLNFDDAVFLDALRASVPARAVELNVTAARLGGEKIS